MPEYLISVIIPAYNAEKRIGTCIESVIAQTYTNWEAILVDDGSADNTLEVLNEYGRRDSRIKVIHQENTGPGGARNKGIDNSNGDYIVFVDSDDTILPDYFERLSECEADVVFIDVERKSPDGKVLSKEYMSGYLNLSRDDFIRYQMTGRILWGGVRKAVKRKLLVGNNIRYGASNVGEEAIYSFLVLHYAETVDFIQGVSYVYINHPGSQSSQKNDDPLRDVVFQLKKELTDRKLFEEYGDVFNAFCITSAIISLDRIAGGHTYREFISLGKKKRSETLSIIDKKYSTDYSHMDRKSKVVYPFFIMGILSPIFVASRIKDFLKGL